MYSTSTYIFYFISKFEFFLLRKIFGFLIIFYSSVREDPSRPLGMTPSQMGSSVRWVYHLLKQLHHSPLLAGGQSTTQLGSRKLAQQLSANPTKARTTSQVHRGQQPCLTLQENSLSPLQQGKSRTLQKSITCYQKHKWEAARTGLLRQHSTCSHHRFVRYKAQGDMWHPYSPLIYQGHLIQSTIYDSSTYYKRKDSPLGLYDKYSPS